MLSNKIGCEQIVLPTSLYKQSRHRKLQIPSSKLQRSLKLLFLERGAARCALNIFPWSFCSPQRIRPVAEMLALDASSRWSPGDSRHEKPFVIAAAAHIFRALCPSRLPEVKQRRRWRKDSRSPPAARCCARNQGGVTCFRQRMRNANANRARRYWSMRLTSRGLRPICRSAETTDGHKFASRRLSP
jgi:hypothetical protein